MSASKGLERLTKAKPTGTMKATLPDGTAFTGKFLAYQYPNRSRPGFFIAESGAHSIIVGFPRLQHGEEKTYIYPDDYPDGKPEFLWIYMIDGTYHYVDSGKLTLLIDNLGNAKGKFTFTGDGPNINDGDFSVQFNKLT